MLRKDGDSMAEFLVFVGALAGLGLLGQVVGADSIDGDDWLRHRPL